MRTLIVVVSIKPQATSACLQALGFGVLVQSPEEPLSSMLRFYVDTLYPPNLPGPPVAPLVRNHQLSNRIASFILQGEMAWS
jgi:hypothetical protein